MRLKVRKRVFYIVLFMIVLLIVAQVYFVKHILDRSLLGIVSTSLERSFLDSANHKIVEENEATWNLSKVEMEIDRPIILWWDALTGAVSNKWRCGTKKSRQCFFTVDKKFQFHPKTKALMFYGTNFRPYGVPLPRRPDQLWALLHEESLKNNPILSARQCQDIFNLTSTFSRNSDFPLTLQYLTSLYAILGTHYLKPTRLKSTNGVGLVAYIHSDCNPPSDRDSYARELMKHVRVDSLGKCLHNKDLPAPLEGMLKMNREELLEILSQYKFVLAFENVICEDYVTEKLWRSFEVGAVPIYSGSPTIRDWLPDADKSVILVSDFESPKSLAEYLQYLAQNDDEYDKYLDYKRIGVQNKRLQDAVNSRSWKIQDYSKPTFVADFECFVCRKAHQEIEQRSLNKTVPLISVVTEPGTKHTEDYMKCQKPFHLYPESPNRVVSMWVRAFEQAQYEAQALVQLMQKGKSFGYTEYWQQFRTLWTHRNKTV